MKAKRRHELQHNVLNSELGKIAQFLKNYGTYLAWAVLASALVFLVVSYVQRQSHGTRQDLLSRFERATSDSTVPPEESLNELKSLADQTSDAHLAARACLAVADRYARMRVAMGPETPSAEMAAMADNARRYYRQAIEQHSSEPLIVASARLGLARLAETQRDFDQAAMEYKAVLEVKAAAGMPAMKLARESLESLATVSAPARMATTAPAKTSIESAQTKPAELKIDDVKIED